MSLFFNRLAPALALVLLAVLPMRPASGSQVYPSTTGTTGTTAVPPSAVFLSGTTTASTYPYYPEFSNVPIGKSPSFRLSSAAPAR